MQSKVLPRVTQQPEKSKRSGFTLVELLIVMGIIVLLMGILLPMASKFRRAAKVATSQQLVTSIEAAISMYQNDQRDWPGPFDNQTDRTSTTSGKFAIGTAKLTVPNGTYDKPTRSEELFLCLSGGLNVTWTANPPFAANTFTYIPEDIGRGHVKLGAKNRGRMKDYLSSSRSRSGVGDVPAKISTDSDIPEFVDSFGRPIIYVRAKKGESNTAAYYPVVAEEMKFYQPDYTYPATSTYHPVSYLQSESLPNQTRQQDRFVLISPGPDAKFGTADDITNFGAPQIIIP